LTKTTVCNAVENELFKKGTALMGKNAGGLLQRLLKADGVRRALEVVEQAKGEADPRRFVANAIYRAERDKLAMDRLYATLGR
jgi:hypothetical protein